MNSYAPSPRQAWDDNKRAMDIYSRAGGGAALNMVEIAQQCIELDKACGELLSHATAMSQQLPGAIDAFYKRDHTPTEKWGQAPVYAAALDLLEALKICQVRLFMLEGYSHEYKIASAAIAKASATP